MTDKPDRLAGLMEAHGVIHRLMAGNVAKMAKILAERHGIAPGVQVTTDRCIAGVVTEFRAAVVPREGKSAPILIVSGHDGTYPWAVEWDPATCRVVAEVSA